MYNKKNLGIILAFIIVFATFSFSLALDKSEVDMVQSDCKISIVDGKKPNPFGIQKTDGIIFIDVQSEDNFNKYKKLTEEDKKALVLNIIKNNIPSNSQIKEGYVFVTYQNKVNTFTYTSYDTTAKQTKELLKLNYINQKHFVCKMFLGEKGKNTKTNFLESNMIKNNTYENKKLANLIKSKCKIETIDGIYENKFGIGTTEGIMLINIQSEDALNKYKTLSEHDKKLLILDIMESNYIDVLGVRNCYMYVTYNNKVNTYGNISNDEYNNFVKNGFVDNTYIFDLEGKNDISEFYLENK